MTKKYILGVDEVGLGPWAGPLVVGACVLNPLYDEDDQAISAELWQEELRDSKKLSPKKREVLAQEIEERSVAHALGWATAQEFDELGLNAAHGLAAARAVSQIAPDLYTEIIVDGNQNFLAGTEYEERSTVLVKADDKIKAVSAASIIAKVARDHYMVDLAEQYPGYGFEKHVGYGTPQHRAALKEYGPCPEHRFSLKPLARWSTLSERGTSGRNTTAIGRVAEDLVAEHLESQGHTIIARNYKTKYYEIDIVSATKEYLYFTEVKYRKSAIYGAPLETITRKKQKQMAFAARCFLKVLQYKLGPEKTLPPPLLAAASVAGDPPKLETWIPLDI